MSSDNDTLTISKCPKCGSPHKYQLEVSRVWVMHNLTATLDFNPVKRTFTRLFTCPTKGEDFQATFWLVETIMDKIESVQVSGLAKETGNE